VIGNAVLIGRKPSRAPSAAMWTSPSSWSSTARRRPPRPLKPGSVQQRPQAARRV